MGQEIAPPMPPCKPCQRSSLCGHGRNRLRGEVAVECGNDLRAFTDRSGDALDRTRAYVADGEDSAPAGFQKLAGGIVEFGAGEHEAFTIERDAGVTQPVGVGVGTDEEEEMADVALLLRAVARPADRFEAT